MHLKNLIEFRSDLFFEGAVQADWFYSKEKSNVVANSFVFHGPKYFGVTSEDVSDSRLMDTASFLERIYNNLYMTTEETNPFTLAIAGYGTGKSHLAVSLAKYFSNFPDDEQTINKINSNLKMADKDIYNNISLEDKKKNFVIVLNGMKDFNLNYEILRSVKLSLKLHGHSEKFLQGISKAHELALGFIKRNFETQSLFADKFKEKGILFNKTEDLKEIIINNIHDETIFSIVDSIYEEVNGHKIRWDEGISANKILEKVEEELCGARGDFNKILIIFDEFGRFLEYASDSPQKAGDSALQQIFEAVQNTDKNIMFIGTIQSDLKTYLTRVDKTSNISRYIGRYDVSDKVYLSSNLETIFANLIEKKDEVAFESFIGKKIESSEKEYHKEVHNNLKRWLPELTTKGVWNNWEKYSQVILKGIYPFHPVSTWLLSSLSNWLQNRSSLTLINRKIKSNGFLELNEFGKLDFISPISLIDEELFSELLSAEEEGRQRSQYCIIYNNILKKYGDKIEENAKGILTANLILRICKFKNSSREDVIRALSILSDMNEILCNEMLEILEVEYGVLQYDEVTNCFDFVGDAVGQADFRRFFKKKRYNTNLNFDILEANSVLLEELGGFSEMETSFGKINDISTNEWKYQEEFLITDRISEETFISLKKSFEKSTLPDQPKGKLLWFYINKDSLDLSISNLKKYVEIYFDKIPITAMVLNDKENSLFDAIKDLITLNSFQEFEVNEYRQFTKEFEEKIKTRIKDIFYKLKIEKNGIEKNEITQITSSRLSRYLDNKFSKIYSQTIPFPFDGFTNKQLSRPKKMFLEISKKIMYSNGKEIDIKTASIDVKNRFSSVFINSWKCVDENTLKLVHPKNIKVSNIYSYIDNQIIKANDKLFIKGIMQTLTKPPFGLNDYSASLIIFSYIANREYETRINLDGKFYTLSNWSEKLILNNGKDLDFKMLENSEINIVDTGEEDSKVRKIISDIRSNSDIERSIYLSNELEKLLSLVDIDGDLKALVEIGQSRLEFGKKLLQKYSEQVASLRYSLEDAQKDDDKSIENLVKIVKKVKSVSRELEYAYVYTENQYSIFLEIEYLAKRLISKHFEKWIDKLNCREVGKLNSFEKGMKFLGKDLYELGYIEYQQQLISKIDKIVKNIDKIRIYQHLKEFIDNFNRECILSSYTKYVELKAFQEKANEYLLIIKENNELFEEDKDELKKDLSYKLKDMSRYIKIIETEMTIIYDLVEEAKNIDDLDYILNKISSLKTRGLEDDIYEEFNYIGNFIMDFKNKINFLKEETDISIISEKKNEILDEVIDDEYGLDLSNVLETYIKEILDKLEEKSSEWESKFLKLSIKELGNRDLNKWMKETEVLPGYLSENILERYVNLKAEILEKLSEDKVKYILSLINELTLSEKEKIKNNLK